MRIKEFALWSYGPLKDGGRRVLGSFNLFYGPNEAGKTLTIDALVKMLLGRWARGFAAIDRVEGSPEGYLLLETASGKQYSLPREGDLPTLFGLSADCYRNVFIIRNSDLSISREGEFYQEVTHHLTGLRTEKIEKLSKGLRELAGLTPGGDFKDTAPLKLKSALKRARDLLAKLEARREQAGKEPEGEPGEELVRLQEQKEDILRQLERCELIRRRELRRKGEEALGSLLRLQEEAERLRPYREEEENRWGKLEEARRELESRVEEAREKLRREREAWQGAQEELQRLERQGELLEKRREAVQERVEPLLERYLRSKRRQASASWPGRESFIRRASLILSLLFLLACAGAILRPAALWGVMMAATLVLLLAAGALKLRSVLAESRLAAAAEQIRQELSRAGIDTGGEPPEALARFYDLYQEEQKRRLKAAEEAGSRERLCSLLEGSLNELYGALRDREKELRRLQASLPVSSLKEYRERRRRKEEVENRIQRQRAVLEGLFGHEGLPLEEQLLRWEAELALLPREEEGEAASPGREPACRQAGVAELKEQLQALAEREKELESRLEEQRRELAFLEKELNAILGAGSGYLPLQTAVDLEAAAGMLHRWIEEHEFRRECALEALSIFQEIGLEEEEKVQALFNQDSPAGAYFSAFTEGRYSALDYDPRSRTIMAVPREGPALAAHRLSGGAYDQLYFAIRLALGERLLEGEKGFFILDDPYIKADLNRLARQLEQLLRLSERGWQFLYFTAKQEVVDTLQKLSPEGGAFFPVGGEE